MKKIFTLVTAGVLAAGSLSAQAQVSLDGQLTAAEVTAGNYQLIGKFTNPRGFGDWGLLSLYAASTPTKLYFFVGGTVENNGNAFQLFMDLPGTPGVPVGTALPAGAASTSFQNMTARLDLAADMALALRADGSDYQIEGASYTSGTVGTSQKLTSTAGTVAANGMPQNLSMAATIGTFAKFAGARVAYRGTTDGRILTNPGNVSPNTSAAYGGVGSYGWEIELDRVNMALNVGTPSLSIFLVQNSGDGGYLSSDFIPQTSAPLTTNGGNLATSSMVDFATIVGRQAATITLGANGVLGTKVVDAASIGMNVFPNPANGQATVSYNVASRSEQVSVVLTDLMGRTVRVLETGAKTVGTQTVSISSADVAAGTYLVQVRVGDNLATRKVVLL
ncbi:hypothetical protein GCM10023185_18200 [Hymenobacter saemangeumensis]|uniref:Secretion system C-terminal sorting domain-containing protein n=1 Tax=Hymenobacter saemangeumensis TaxID=1084522 RepID=A0ABP8IBD8_9BACT